MPALRALAAAGHQVAAVYTQPDRPAGRGRRLTASAVKQCALELGIAVEQPGSLREDAAAGRLVELQPQAMVVVAYGLILPPTVLRIPSLGCINIHASLLPRWRGAAPIQRAVLAGDNRTGVSIMQMEAGLDTGPVFLQEETHITAEDTGGSLHDRLAELGARAVVQVLTDINAGGARAQEQNEATATYASKIQKSEACIDWTQAAEQIERQVRAFNPRPVAQTQWQGRQLRVWSARAVSAPSSDAVPGTVVVADTAGIVVACGIGALSLQTVQLPGGRVISAAAFLNAHPPGNARLG